MPLDHDCFFEGTVKTAITKHHDALRKSLTEEVRKHGRTDEWDQVLESVAVEPSATFDFSSDTVVIGEPTEQPGWEATLKALMPWRKGPFNILGTVIDTEWRSDWKWQRIQKHFSSLENKLVLDVG